MKKIALLFTIVCIGQLYGMEQSTEVWSLPEAEHMSQLPKELKKEIINTALTRSENLDEVIEIIQKLSVLHNVSYEKLFNLKDFTQLVHMLANQFDITTAEVAKEFDTSIAHTYRSLGHNLLDFVCNNVEFAHAKVIELIKKGADVNFSSHKEPLEVAIKNHNDKGVQLLLEAGANPTDEDWYDAENEVELLPNFKEAVTIKDLIERAMKK